MNLTLQKNKLSSSIFKIALIIPCFNEADRLNIDEYCKSLSKHKVFKIYFIDDGSTDNTFSTIEQLKNKFTNQIEILSLPKNSGKAEAVRLGMLHALKNEKEINLFGFLDADLATSIEELLNLSKILEDKNLDMVFGSRISMVGTNIERNKYRHIVGRVIATITSNILKLRVYDTQCGAKVFTRQLVNSIFNKSFLSKWLFDVEIFARILCDEKQFNEKNILEIPIKKWIDKDGSKVEFSYMFKLFFDLYKIRKSYPKLKKRKDFD